MIMEEQTKVRIYLEQYVMGADEDHLFNETCLNVSVEEARKYFQTNCDKPLFESVTPKTKDWVEAISGQVLNLDSYHYVVAELAHGFGG